MKFAVAAALCLMCVVGVSANNVANKFSWIAQDGDFKIATVALPTKDDAQFGAGVSAAVSITGTVENASKILAGTLQYKIYESYVQHFTQEGNMDVRSAASRVPLFPCRTPQPLPWARAPARCAPGTAVASILLPHTPTRLLASPASLRLLSQYFKCTNKGCDGKVPLGLDLAQPTATTDSDFSATLPFTMPVAKKTGAFTMVIFGQNQNHFPCALRVLPRSPGRRGVFVVLTVNTPPPPALPTTDDFSLTLSFNYSSPEVVAVVPTPVTTSTYAPGKITWAASGGNMSVNTFEILAEGGTFVAGESAHVNQTGSLDKALTAGAVQWQVYEQGVRSFIESGNSNYFKCTNKGCDIMSPISLALTADTVPCDYTLQFAFNIPTPEATGEFTLVAWGTDQDHFPYDFSISAHFKVPMSA